MRPLCSAMIQLTRLNNQLLVVNSELIKFIERSPDTVLTLITGEKVVVTEPVEVILQKITEFRRRIYGSVPEVVERPASATEGPPRTQGAL